MVAGRQTLARIRPIDQIIDAPFHVAGHAKGQRDQEAKDEDLRTYCGGHSFENSLDKKDMLGVSIERRGWAHWATYKLGMRCLDLTRLRQCRIEGSPHLTVD